VARNLPDAVVVRVAGLELLEMFAHLVQVSVELLTETFDRNWHR
jgi:hypothetical protein